MHYADENVLQPTVLDNDKYQVCQRQLIKNEINDLLYLSLSRKIQNFNGINLHI